MTKRRRIIYILVSLVASILLWYYVVTVVSVESTDTIYNIPVTFSGEESLREQGLTITDGKNATVTLRITGKRTDVANLNSDNITVTVDVSKIRAADTFSKSYTISYPSTVSAANITVNSKTPDAVSFTVEQLVTKDVPVKAVFNGTVAEGYMLDSCEPTQSSISVTGTAEQVDPISKAIVICDGTDMTASENRSLEYTLVDEDGNEIDMTGLETDTAAIGVHISVLCTKTVPLSVDLVSGGGATEANVTCTITPSVITISGEESVLNNISKVTLDTISLATITENTVLNKSIVLPDGVRNESGELTAEIDLELTDLSTRAMSISSYQIVFQGQPEGYTPVAVATSVTVNVRGSGSAVNQVKASDITITADVAEFTAGGTYTCNNVTVELANNPDCGVVGTYSVVFTLMTAEEYEAYQAENRTEP